MTAPERRVLSLGAVVVSLVLGVIAAPARPAASATGRRGVVAAEHILAAAAGIEMLRKGGNAIDAAVAAALTACVVHPSSCGIGGGGFLLFYDARQGRAFALDYRETAPARATAARFRDEPAALREGGTAVAVPGQVAGLAAAHSRFGRLPLPTVMEPAIAHARHGVPVSAHLAKQILCKRSPITASPDLAAVFLRPDGTPHAEGDLLRQPRLADTLEAIAREGPGVFYRGRIAARIVEAVRAAGGLLEAGDVARYQARWRRPLKGEVGGATVLTMPPPSSGGVLLEILQSLGHDHLSALGHNSPTYLHLLAETFKRAFADRARYYGDPDFGPIPLGRLISWGHAHALRRSVSAVRAGTVTLEAPRSADAGTSHLSVIDGEGNAVACTNTINTAFGSLIAVPKTGIILNNEMDDFSLPGVPNVYGLVGEEPNAISPGKRPLSSMTPVIVLAGGHVRAVAGGSGGPTIITATAQVLLNSLAFHATAERAVASPRIHHQWQPDRLWVETGVPPGVRAALARRGHSVAAGRTLGVVSLAVARSGMLEGAGDPRKGGDALAW